MKNIFIMGRTMESTAHKIRKLYPEMGRAEKKIADYILENSRNITECSVTELAKICGCGDATVVRFSRRLGYDGFQALKIGIAGELGNASTVSGEIKKTSHSRYQGYQEQIKIRLCFHQGHTNINHSFDDRKVTGIYPIKK